MSRVEAWLDETPGETRCVIARDGRFEQLFIQREDQPPEHRLGARLVVRVSSLEPGLKGAFIDLGGAPPDGFLAVGKAEALAEGAIIEVEVTAEPREGKGPQLRRIGPASGEPRLLEAGPDVRELLAESAPGVTPIEGLAAIQAGWDAEEDGLFPGTAVEALGLDLMVERTRAMVTVDLDLLPSAPGQPRQARERANRAGLAEAARLIRLKRWGGLVAVDLIGTGHDGETVLRWAKAAFGNDPSVGYGPVNRFGVLMLSLPWRRTPLEEVLRDASGRPTLRTQAQDAVRALRSALLSETGTPRLTLACSPAEAEMAKGWVEALGPRAVLRAEPERAPGRFEILEA